MGKLWIFSLLMIAFVAYSIAVYTEGTEVKVNMSMNAVNGKLLFQKYNCTSCHQLYGLGGYLGPELTVCASHKPEAYIKAMLKTGSQRMPDFHLKEEEINDIVTYLKYVDSTAITYK